MDAISKLSAGATVGTELLVKTEEHGRQLQLHDICGGREAVSIYPPVEASKPGSRGTRACGSQTTATPHHLWAKFGAAVGHWPSRAENGFGSNLLANVLILIAVVGFSVLPSAAAHGQPVRGKTPTTTAKTMRAYDYYSKFGANTDINAGETIASILTELQYLGIYNIRDSIFSEGYAAAFAQLAAEGVKLHMDFQGWINPAPSMSEWLGWLKTYLVVPYPGSVVGVAGPNEVDNTGSAFVYAGLSGIAAADQAQQDLYNGIKADPVLKNIPVDMWPLGSPYNSSLVQQVGNTTAYCNRANMHDYYNADNNSPDTQVTVYGNMQVQLPLYLADYQEVCNQANWVTTETGWYTPGPASSQATDLGITEYVQARLLLNDLFDHAMLPNCQAVYIFDLQWGSEDGSDPGFGVFHDDGTPKQSGTAIRNLMAILNDPGVNAATFIPASLTYSLSGMPVSSGNFLVAKSNGSFDIILWNETPIWSVASATQISVPTSAVTLTLPARSSGYVYNPIQGSTPIAAFNNVNQLSLQLNDAPLIVEIR